MGTKLRFLLDVLIFSLIVSLLYVLGIGCPIKYVTGVSCPGCGITRAVVSCVRLDFRAAVYYYPMLVTAPAAAFVVLIRNRIPDRMKKILTCLMLVAIMVVYLARMADSSNHIVVFEPGEGAIARMFHN